MYLTGIVLQNFRSYSSSHFRFSNQITFIVGPNTSGKSNLMESIHVLSSGKSFRTDTDIHLISLGKEIARVAGKLQDDTKLEVMITNGNVGGVKSPYKKYMVNGVARRRADFAGHLSAVLFSPSDLEIIVDSPGIRREFLDTILEQADREYRLAKQQYDKAIRQRNALLENIRESGVRNEKLFEYWNELVIAHGTFITQKREEFIDFINAAKKDIFTLEVMYDKSVISSERLEQYREREIGAGVTLIGPHRDDFVAQMKNKKQLVDVKQYGSRGQQRLAIVQLKILQMEYIQKKRGVRPILLLDDIFSELDEAHIQHVLDMTLLQQTIITTTHKEFITHKKASDIDIIEL